VIRGVEVEFDTHTFEHTLPEVTGEDPISISYYDSWKSMQLEDVVSECLGYDLGSSWVLHGDEIGIFCKSVYHHQNQMIWGDLL
jgi:hypothetical protein